MKKTDRQSDHYKTLGVAPSATADEIKKAYRKLARQYHPDVSKAPDAEARFKEIGRANQVLKDPERRAAYDRGEEPDNPDGSSPNPSAHRPPPGWQPGFDSQGGFSGSPFGGEEGLDAESILEAFMGHQRRAGGRGGARPRAPQRQRGEDYSAELLIDLADSYHGAQRPVHLQVPVHDAHGQLVMTDRTLQVTIPRGLRAGQHLRLAGQGGPGRSSVPGDDPASLAGDLLLQVAFRPHPHFTVQGSDVLLGLPLAPWEAALGASIAVPTPTGQVMMTIPPGTPEGRSLRLRGQGLPASGAGKHAGNLVATVHIAWPPANTDTERLAYTAMQASFAGFEARAALA